MLAHRGNRPTFGELAAAVAVGFALWGMTYYGMIDVIGNVRNTLDDEDDGPSSPAFAVYDLSFHVGDTEIYYGQTLVAVIATTLLVLLALLVFRRRRANVATCPHCLSAIPDGAAVCASCTRDVAPTAP